MLDRLATARVEQASPVLVSMIGADALKASFVSHLAEDLKRLTNDELAEGFARHCPVDGAVPDDYKSRLLDLPGFGQSLVGIRFRGLDLARPFVTIAASEQLPNGQRELQLTLDAMADEFKVFAPKHVRVFLPSHSNLEPRRPGQFWEKRLLVGSVADMRQLPRPPGYDRLVLAPPTDDGWYTRYEAAFEGLVHAAPEYLEWTRLETQEDLADVLQEGTLFEVTIDGRWAGVTAVALDGIEGVDGYLMIEILLAEHARGKGFGAALQRRLVERLPDPEWLLLGTIDARNVAAIRAATAVGRVDVGGYLWAAFT